MSIGFRVAARSHVGVVRTGNEDAGLADSRLLAVADGMGGHAAGEVASAAVVQTLADAITDLPADREAAAAWIVERINDAHNRVGDLVAEEPEHRGMGTTLSAVLACDDGCVLAHVGDSRVYTLRGGQLWQASTDHTFVQTLVESGEITEEQAAHHPRRNLLMRAIDGVHAVDVDVIALDLQVGDRVLLCSDGLTGVLPDSTIAELLQTEDLTLAVAQLIDFALAGGAPDNVTVVLAELVSPAPASEPCLVGSVLLEEAVLPASNSAAAPPRSVRRWLLATGLGVIALTIALMSANGWISQQWYLGSDGERVVVFQGIPQSIGPVGLSRPIEVTRVMVAALDPETQRRIREGVSADSLSAAQATLAEIVSMQECAATGCESP